MKETWYVLKFDSNYKNVHITNKVSKLIEIYPKY